MPIGKQANNVGITTSFKSNDILIISGIELWSHFHENEFNKLLYLYNLNTVIKIIKETNANITVAMISL